MEPAKESSRLVNTSSAQTQELAINRRLKSISYGRTVAILSSLTAYGTLAACEFHGKRDEKSKYNAIIPLVIAATLPLFQLPVQLFEHAFLGRISYQKRNQPEHLMMVPPQGFNSSRCISRISFFARSFTQLAQSLSAIFLLSTFYDLEKEDRSYSATYLISYVALSILLACDNIFTFCHLNGED